MDAKKRVSFIGTCISYSILQQLECKACFEYVESYFDALPWHFNDCPIPSKNMDIKGSKLHQKSCDMIFNNGEMDLGIDYLLIDLYALIKTMYRCEVNEDNVLSTVITYLTYTEIMEHNERNNLKFEYLSHTYEMREYIQNTIVKFSDYLVSRYETSKIIILRPKIAKRYLSVQMHIESVSAEEIDIRTKEEQILLEYTDYLINLLKGCIVVDLPDDVVADSKIMKVHYLQGDYRRMAKCLLESVHINYRDYWECELSPETLQFAYWVRQNKWLHKMLIEEQEERYGIRIVDNCSIWAEPTQINASIESRGLKIGKTYMSIWVSRNANRILAYWGAGERCKQMFGEYDLPVKLIIDNDTEKANKEINGVKIVHASEISNWSKYIIIITCDKSYEVEKQLVEMGLEKKQDYLVMGDYYL